MSNKIDVHHHVYPPCFTEALNQNGGDPSGWYIPEWSIELDKEICEKIDVEIAILSVTAPGPACIPDSKGAARLARECNEYVAKVCKETQTSTTKRYGFFACLPSLLDTEACLEEIRFAFDELHADGIILYSRYGKDNHYLGHKDFIEIWKELNKRKSIVFIHPTHSVDTNLVNKFLPQPAFDYPHETGRTAIDLILSNTLSQYASNCKIILSHAGGTLPSLIGRVSGALPFTPFTKSTGKDSDQIMKEAGLFYFDTALSSNPASLAGLFEIANPDHILFGSDFPNAPSPAIEFFTNQLTDAVKKLDSQSQKGFTLEKIARENALKLFPRLQK